MIKMSNEEQTKILVDLFNKEILPVLKNHKEELENLYRQAVNINEESKPYHIHRYYLSDFIQLDYDSDYYKYVLLCNCGETKVVSKEKYEEFKQMGIVLE